MSQLTPEDAVADWAIEHPESIPIFEKYGIDYSCGGKSLAYLCHQKNCDPQRVVAEIRGARAVHPENRS